jgi:hypothetical protein
MTAPAGLSRRRRRAVVPTGGGGLPATALLLENNDGIQLETGSTDSDVLIMET